MDDEVVAAAQRAALATLLEEVVAAREQMRVLVAARPEIARPRAMTAEQRAREQPQLERRAQQHGERQAARAQLGAEDRDERLHVPRAERDEAGDGRRPPA